MKSFKSISAPRAMASVLGAITGSANAYFGIFQALQGNAKPPGLLSVFEGQGAITILPNMLEIGLIGIFLSLFFTVWAAFLVQRKHGGLVMTAIAFVQILLGASLVRALQAMLDGLIGTRIDRPLRIWDALIPKSAREALSRIWPVSFLLISIASLLHVLTPIIPAFTAGESIRVIMGIVGYSGVFLFPLALVTGFSNELLRREKIAEGAEA